MNPSGFRTRFAITPNWITKYQWSVGQHSLVFLNACLSGTSSWRQAFFNAGASVYLGWNKPVRFWAVCGSALDFFSLMLGLNENNGGPGGAVIYPRQRPYDWGEVLYHLRASTWMAGYSDPDEGNVLLEATINQAAPLLFLCLRPSMYWNVFDELTRPAVERAHAGAPTDMLAATVEANVQLTVERLTQTPILAELVAAGSPRIIGGSYDLDSGEVLLIGA